MEIIIEDYYSDTEICAYNSDTIPELGSHIKITYGESSQVYTVMNVIRDIKVSHTKTIVDFITVKVIEVNNDNI